MLLDKYIKENCPHILLQQCLVVLESFEGRSVTSPRDLIFLNKLDHWKCFMENMKGCLIMVINENPNLI